ncbi:hypothetical protein [Streptomyces nitrosporeus]|uniref:hypothetical protein n=1 Tax=Streptomyces nitrosporeus TaxID=28894 RepID=UPI0039A0D71D
MTIHLVGDLLVLAVTLRVFGQDVLMMLRRLAAAGVRTGISEIHRRPRTGKGDR